MPNNPRDMISYQKTYKGKSWSPVTLCTSSALATTLEMSVLAATSAAGGLRVRSTCFRMRNSKLL